MLKLQELAVEIERLSGLIAKTTSNEDTKSVLTLMKQLLNEATYLDVVNNYTSEQQTPGKGTSETTVI